MQNELRKVIVINSQIGVNLCLKCIKIRLMAGFCLDLLGELNCLPGPLAASL